MAFMIVKFKLMHHKISKVEGEVVFNKKAGNGHLIPLESVDAMVFFL